MTDFNKGDFTQQGVDGHVNAKVRLNAKRYLDIDLTSNETESGCTISGKVYDSLNDIIYPIGRAKTISSKTLTENGTYNANVDDCDGYNPVTVNVPQPSGNIAITENTAEGEPLNIAQYATATVNVPSSGIDFVIPEQTVSTTASGNVPIQTNFQEALVNLPGNIVIKMIGEAFGQSIHGLAVMDKTQIGNNTVTYTTEITFSTSIIRINIITLDSGENWGMNIQVDNYQTAFENIFISAIEEWPSTPM